MSARLETVAITFYEEFEGRRTCTLELDQPGDQENPHVLALLALALERHRKAALAADPAQMSFPF